MLVREWPRLFEFDIADRSSEAHHADGAELCVVNDGGVALKGIAGAQPQPGTRDDGRMAGWLQRDCYIAMARLLRYKPLAIKHNESVLVDTQVEELGGARIAEPAPNRSDGGRGGWARNNHLVLKRSG